MELNQIYVVDHNSHISGAVFSPPHLSADTKKQQHFITAFFAVFNLFNSKLKAPFEEHGTLICKFLNTPPVDSHD